MDMLTRAVLVTATCALLGGCFGHGNDHRHGSAASTDFGAFVHAQYASDTRLSETATPVTINDRHFVDRDQDDPAAYDDLLPPQG